MTYLFPVSTVIFRRESEFAPCSGHGSADDLSRGTISYLIFKARRSAVYKPFSAVLRGLLGPYNAILHIPPRVVHNPANGRLRRIFRFYRGANFWRFSATCATTSRIVPVNPGSN